MKELKNQDPNAEFRFWGGDLMQREGGELVKHYRDLAFMGFVEVLLNLRTILGNISFCKKDIEDFRPDALILIDYPGFNMRIAEWAKKEGIQVLYYISPQIWAWKQGRVHKIKKVVDKMYCILPFEKDFYARFEVDVDFVGHPLLDAITDFRKNAFDKVQFLQETGLSDKPVIAVLPGSRKQEISVKLPIMLEGVKSFSDYQIVIAGAPAIEASFYETFIENDKDVSIVF